MIFVFPNSFSTCTPFAYHIYMKRKFDDDSSLVEFGDLHTSPLKRFKADIESSDDFVSMKRKFSDMSVEDDDAIPLHAAKRQKMDDGLMFRNTNPVNGYILGKEDYTSSDAFNTREIRAHGPESEKAADAIWLRHVKSSSRTNKEFDINAHDHDGGTISGGVGGENDELDMGGGREEEVCTNVLNRRHHSKYDGGGGDKFVEETAVAASAGDLPWTALPRRTATFRRRCRKKSSLDSL